MLVASVFEKDIPLEKKIEIVQKVYENCWNSETLLFNIMSQIAQICSEQGSSVWEKIEEIKSLSCNALEQSKQIGLTNPDIYGSMERKNSLAKEMKLARMHEKI
jgi:hypothetical protein